MMRTKSALWILLVLACASAYAQQTTDSLHDNIQKLDAGDLIFKKDTAEMNVTSASRSSSEVSDVNIRNGYNDDYNPLQYLQKKGVKYTIGSTVTEPINITEQRYLYVV